VALTPPATAGSTRKLMRRAPKAGVVVPYDFKRPTKLSREHVRTLQMSYETYSRRLTTVLTSELRQVCLVSLVAIEHQSYEEYIAGLEQSTLTAVLDIDPLHGTALLEFSIPTALACVDHMLGGPGGEQPDRQLTDIESGLIRGLIDQMLSVLRFAAESTIGLAPVLRSIEFAPQFVQAAAASDSVIVASFEMVVGKQTCVSTLCVPFAAILPRLQAGREQRAQSSAERLALEQAAREVAAALGGVPVEVTLSMQPSVLTSAQLVALRPGDIVPLRHRVTTPLTIRSHGITFAQALAGRQGSRLAGLVVGTSRETKQ
jgi:flagellar motor switch protein FliM